jgi:P27 family predicted phage terminase small subunit
MRSTSTATKKAQGTYRADRDRSRSLPVQAQPDMTPPKYLNRIAKAEWNRIYPLLLEQNTFRELDRSLVASYCQYFAHWIASEADLARNGLVINVTSQTRTGSTVKPIQNPSLRNSVAAHRQMLAVSSKFGISALDRSKVDIPTESNEEDELDKFLNGYDYNDEQEKDEQFEHKK